MEIKKLTTLAVAIFLIASMNFALASDEYTPKEFSRIYSGDFNGPKFNLYFVNYSYKSQNAAELFSEDVQNLVFLNSGELRGFLYAEPFKTYKDRFNIYRLDASLDGKVPGCNTKNPCDPEEILKYVSGAYSIPAKVSFFDDGKLPFRNIFILIVPGSEDAVKLPGALGAAIPSGVYMNRDMRAEFGIEAGIIDFFHEFGHSFAGISDEYGQGYMHGRDYSDIYVNNVHSEAMNCDPVPGCPSWCSGEPKEIQRNDPCAKRSNKQDCENEYFQEDGFYDCTWIEDVPKINDYFGSKCVPALEDYGNIGNSCAENTGCFFGCYGNGWRSTRDSIYAGFFDEDYKTYSKGGLYPYNDAQEKRIISNFTRALPASDEKGQTCCSECAKVYSVTPNYVTFKPCLNVGKTDPDSPYHLSAECTNYFETHDKTVEQCLAVAATEPKKPDKTEADTEVAPQKQVDCGGCIMDDGCYEPGTGIGKKFCLEAGDQFKVQKKDGFSCTNGFECSSNTCVAGKCFTDGIIEQILKWFKQLFGLK